MWFPWSLKVGINQDNEYDVRSIPSEAITQFIDSIIFFALCSVFGSSLLSIPFLSL